MRHLLCAGLALLIVVPLATSAPRAMADPPTYDVKQAEAQATVGVKGKTSVTIAARPGWHVNEQAPLTMKLTPDQGITVDKPRLTRADLAHQTPELARFDVAFTPSEPGRKTINAEASFVMCQATTCMPVKEKIVLAVAVAAAKKK
jgi:hypothetical protein